LGNEKLVMTLIIILAVDVMLMFGQISANAIGSDYNLSAPNFFDKEASFINQFDEGEYQVITNSTGLLPETENSVSTETGNIFTDGARSIRTWFSKSTGSVVSGWNFFTSFLSGPTGYLRDIGAPIEFVFGFGALWYGLTTLLIILLIFNR